MSESPTGGRALPSIEIVPANDGGFVVMVGDADFLAQPSGRVIRSFDYAGSLDEALAYVRIRLTLPSPPVQEPLS